MDTCILIPSYEKYRVLAGITANQIDRHWRDHPPILFCGLSNPARQGDTLLMLQRSSDDWISILIDAVREVRERARAIRTEVRVGKVFALQEALAGYEALESLETLKSLQALESLAGIDMEALEQAMEELDFEFEFEFDGEMAVDV